MIIELKTINSFLILFGLVMVLRIDDNLESENATPTALIIMRYSTFIKCLKKQKTNKK